ncbi:DUF1802 family protein [Paenibacillus sp. UNC451MF]|uniref:DUF1802 family protein n=1 Tax=Paenibacillus sp. UNC451MF TaxID=1449063 RepID=UPI00048CC6A2|nr:DUF1802 family protein [Paenibacillus sp. UNC451MF]
MSTQPIALKEWAVAVEALRSGRQILIMRKGGIREETKNFQVESDSFYLFPTYEHQKKHWIKNDDQPELDKTLENWSVQDTEVTIRCYAELAEDILVDSQERLDKLSAFHLWTDSFAEERLKWKRTQPLHVMLLRVYELAEPVRLPILAEYNGCKSWIQLDSTVLDPMERKAVLNDEDFQDATSKIKSALG